MRKILAYPLSVIFYLAFGLCLVIFHGIQWICFNFLGYQPHKKSVDYLNFLLLRCLNLLGTTFTYENPYTLSRAQPCIIVANHQGQYDIPPIIWFMRRFHPKFISKKELGKGIPSISYNLRHGGSVLIDRNDTAQSLEAIKSIASYINQNNRSVVIFPEGTRSRDGIPTAFAKGGMRTLIENIPTALIVPVTISNSWKLMRWGAFPLDIGVRVKLQVHKPIPVAGRNPDDLIQETQDVILADFTEIRPRRKSHS